MKVSFLLFLLFSLSFCYDYSNDPQLCNYRGIMTSSGTCACESGYYGQNCTISPATDSPQLWQAVRAIILFEYVVLMVIVTLGLIYSSKKNLPKTIFFIGMTLFAYSQFVKAIDIYSFYGIYPYTLSLFFIAMSDCLEFPCYLLVLIYWMEIYHLSMKLLRDIELLKKVNTFFSKEVTVEEVSNRANRLTKLRIPLIIVLIIGIILVLIQLVFNSLYLEVTAGPVTYINLSYNAICKLGICIGFLIYGRRLIRIMPVQHFARINYISKLTFIASAILVFNWFLSIVLFAAVAKDPVSFSISFLITTSIAIPTDIVLVAVFFKKNDKFPYIYNSNDQIFLSSSEERSGKIDNSSNTVDFKVTNKEEEEEEEAKS